MKSRINFFTDENGLKNADFAVEAASEDFNIKKSCFLRMAEHTPDHCILATNTSSISISKIAGVIPDRAH
jgi:3-hydroxybutyryl-CoA dehydrogenase